ncbi:MAG: HAMP domain-containing histidine kinase [Clostridia bacterium]|nr:HAMP domain-containing histidine kinase [Clostridia bacterium]
MAKKNGGQTKDRSRKAFLASGIKRRWFINNVSVMLIVVILLAVMAAIILNQYYYGSVRSNLEMRANTTSRYLNRYMGSSYSEFYEYSRSMVKDFSDADKVEMQILDEYGRVMFSSIGLTAGFIPSTGEVSEALKRQETVTYNGYDILTGEKVMATTSPIFYSSGRTIGAVRYVTSMKIVEKQLGKIYLLLAGGVVGIMLLLISSNIYFLRSIVNPVIRINQLAQKITGGQYGVRLDVEFNDEIGELCMTLNNMSEELARMDKLKNDFISSVSHELRTPLTAINGWAETVANDLDDPEIARSGLEIIRNETLRLSQMVEEMLDFSRIESGGLKLQTELFDLRGDLYDAVFVYTDMLKKEGVAIHYDEPDEPIMVFADKNRLKQVFLNIIDNAAKYGKDGGKVDITIKNDGDMGLVSIRDYGQGIPENELPFVKEKFFKGSARGRGTGIGLAVCNEIMTLHGGTLDINSVYGEGTEAVISLPIYKEADGD